ncbi:suppressor of tub2 mutation [Pseudogymnoascus destructans]|uniref:Suppressor of tub2 mutation n=1 Tax=Pseudogymnoascus destructans TaxID=655981 RepID=A0A177AHA4_9PEZI|nr:suppressor of tub2 mutation [Pseudogymnoascus destructans]OAF61448.1 suppressor of tub2 mutation [Pseudogymnoascus destructans]
MGWIVQMHEEYGLQFRSFVPSLMELLEDADGMVRDCARNTVIELFQNAPNAAKSDLKKQLKAFNVRTTIVSAITSQLSPTGADLDPIDQHTASPNLRSHHSESTTSASSTTARPVTPVIEQRVLEHVEPAYVNTTRELEDTLRDMHPFFDGKESEHNWLKREQSCSKLRKLNAGNAPADFHDAWLVGVKALLDGILKSVNSLRTSLSKEGCAVVQEIARTAGPGLDPMVEILLQNLIKLCGGTKKIASQAGDATVDIILLHVSYNQRILQHVWLACQDKNVQPRTYAAGWLKTLLKKLANHKSQIEHAGGLDIVEKCVKKGLADPNPGVREKMRGTFWPFAQMWPAKAEAVMSALEPAQLKLLQNDPGNPNSPKKTNPVARPGLALSKSTGPPKPSLREALLAQKKAAMAAKTLPARPGSAMSSFSPMRTASASSNLSTATAPPGRSRLESTTTSHGGLSVAPMRPTKFRPKEPPRPATAGPYSVRQAPATATPSTTRPAARTPSAATLSPKRGAVPRPNTGHSSHASQSSNTSPIREKASVAREASIAREETVAARESPRPKPQQQQTHNYIASSPSKAYEDFTMVIPTLTSLPSSAPPPASPPAPIQRKETPRLVTPAKAVKVYEDPFSAGDDETTPRPPPRPQSSKKSPSTKRPSRSHLPPPHPKHQPQTPSSSPPPTARKRTSGCSIAVSPKSAHNPSTSTGSANYNPSSAIPAATSGVLLPPVAKVGSTPC